MREVVHVRVSIRSELCFSARPSCVQVGGGCGASALALGWWGFGAFRGSSIFAAVHVPHTMLCTYFSVHKVLGFQVLQGKCAYGRVLQRVHTFAAEWAQLYTNRAGRVASHHQRPAEVVPANAVHVKCTKTKPLFSHSILHFL